ncbi:MAG: PKD domain-containing protein [Desulfuromonadales bacterium]|nr:MAG: PKD domain-containing protein [Desulfuromonadales bacterium]
MVPQFLMVLWAMAALLLVGPGTVPEASALTEADCRSCHTGGTYPNMAEQHHAVGTAKGLSCYTAGCHNLVPNGSGGFVIEVVRDCIRCHGQYDHSGAHNMLSTASDCGQCHTQQPVAEHKSICATCHNSTKPEVINTINIGKGPNGQPVNCTNCHGALNHVQQHDKAFPATECIQCHAQGVLNEHLNRGSTCATCHNSTRPEVINAINLAKGPNGQPVNCTNCHGALNHVQQHDKVSTPVDCNSCHNLGVVFEHTKRSSTCATCHSSSNQTVINTINIAKGPTGTQVSCANCHGTVNHLLQHDKAVADAFCASCHTLGVVNEHLSRALTCGTCHSSTNTTVQQTIATGKAGTVVTCTNCHGSVNHILQHDKVSTPADCASCHAKNVVNEHIDRTSTCATCHSSTNQTVLNTINIAKGPTGTQVSCANCHGTVNHVAQHDKAASSPECAQCHTKTVLDEHFSRGSTCATCHSSSRLDVQNAITAGKAGTVVNCVTCHGQYNHPTAHTGKVNAPYADCNACHITNLTELHAREGFQCAACHASTNAAVTAAVQKGLGGQPVVCADCHNAIGGFGNHAGQHDKISLIDATGFIAKHEQAPTPVRCVGCHTSTNATVVKVINNGMAGIQQSCNACHSVAGNNLPPTANAGADKVVTVNQAVTFTGSGTDPDGTIASYAWTFGDGTTGSGASVSKTYTTAGTYTATLTVTDNAGATASDTAIVTVQAAPTSGAVFADQVLHMQRLSTVTSSDTSITDITAKFRDGNTTDRYLLQSGSSGSNNVISMKLNRDALTATKVTLRVHVSSISSSRTLRIYPYQSNGTSVNTGYSVSYNVSSTGWKEIDVTSIAQRMNGYGWMKFRVTTTSSTLDVSEGGFLVQ